METKPYLPANPDIEWVAGQRVQHDSSGEPEPLMLTDAQAEPELARGTIVPAESKAAAEDGTTTRRKAREV